VLLIANHVSWMDICVIASITGATFVAKSEVARWPVIGRIATGFGAFLHERGNLMDVWRVKNAVAAALRRGSPVVVFPEGTTGWSINLMPFYPALAQAAVDADTIVQPVAIRYRDQHGEPSAAAPFLGDQTFVDSLRAILQEHVIRAELFFGEPYPASGRTRREITAIAHRFIASALGLRESCIRADPRRLRNGAGALHQSEFVEFAEPGEATAPTAGSRAGLSGHSDPATKVAPPPSASRRYCRSQVWEMPKRAILR
jgi:1-acyl-sn-glycerol-3-phosphate acyltransferase